MAKREAMKIIRTQPPLVYYRVGLDLGQTHEFTALAVVEVCAVPGADARRPALYHAVRHLERFPIGTPYGAICERLAEVFADKALSGSTLVIDQTGVGTPVIDMIRQAKIQAAIRLVTMTAGHAVTQGEHGVWLVPKRDIVGSVQIVLQSQRLKIAQAIPEAAILVRELETFHAKVTLASDDAALPWRDRPHDDLVLACGVAVWDAERWGPPEPAIAPYVHRSSGWWRRGW